ncbi:MULTISPECIES: hypothetical protein [Bacteroidales]|uniref:hypothetical protein n=1 Tax=Bacteroidales TaxID=171549 RepID=UPI0025B69A66|nr:MULTISPECIES: hypothetical protein [Bacteroidales]
MEKHLIKQPLRLVGGKFMRGDLEEPIQIGNREQIALIQKVEREKEEREKAAKAGILDVDIHVEDIEYKVVVEFTCICGNEVRERNTNFTDDWDELENPDCDGDEIRCDKCGRWYEIDDLHAKLTKDCLHPPKL